MARRTCLLLSLGVLLSACGGTRSAAPGSRPPLGARTWQGYREIHVLPVRAPVVRAARWRRIDEVRFAVTLLPYGDLWLGERQVRLSADRSGAALAELRSALTARWPPGARGDAGTARPPELFLAVDRFVRWVDVRDVLRVVWGEPVRCDRIAWSVAEPSVPPPLCEEARVTPLDREGDDVLPVALTGRWQDEDRTVAELGLSVGTSTWTWTESTFRLDPAPAFAAVLDHARSAMRPAKQGVRRVSLRVPGTSRVLWDHVARVLGLFLESGVTEVDLPEEKVHVSLLPPEDIQWHQDFAGDPVVTPLVVLLSLIALVLALALTWWPLRGVRRGRARPSRR